jgi:hypothetical protein
VADVDIQVAGRCKFASPCARRKRLIPTPTLRPRGLRESPLPIIPVRIEREVEHNSVC